MKLTLAMFLKLFHAFLAGLYLLFALFGSWAKRGDPDEGVFSADGGTGFGLIAVILGVLLVALAVMRLMGKSHVLPGLGVEQLTIVLGLAATLNLIAFIVGWLAVFPAGTGWGVVAAYFPASFIPQIGLLTLSAAEPAKGIAELEDNKRVIFSIIAALAGAGIAVFPALDWLSAGSVKLSAYDGAAGNARSGPRFGYVLLVLGAIVLVAALMRLRPKGLAEPGPNALLSHALFAVGVAAVVIPISTLISILRLDIDVSAGIGLWLGLLAGIVLIVLGIVENRTRGAVAA